MGCMMSSERGVEVSKLEKEKRKSSGASTATPEKTMLHTNSMLLPSKSIEDAQNSTRQQSLRGDVEQVLMNDCPGYVLGQDIQYAPNITKTFVIDQVLGKSKIRKLEFGYKSVQGRSSVGPNKPNQDSLVVFHLKGYPDHVVFGVFDGHGPYGQFASHFCRTELHKTMLNIYDEYPNASPEKLLQCSIQRIHNAFINSDPFVSGVDSHVSGTTLIVALLIKDTVYVANVGDSRCIMGLRSNANDSKARVIAMSDDHKPERASETARIAKTEAVLLTEGQLRGGEEAGKTYVCRRDEKGNISYGVLFSRSVGDRDAHECLGIESKAEIIKGVVDPTCSQYIVLASDGVWDQLTNEQVMRRVFRSKDPMEASEEIASIAAKRWDNDPKMSRRDDITILVAKLS